MTLKLACICCRPVFFLSFPEGPTDKRDEIKLRNAFHVVVRIAAAVIAGLFLLAALAEWVRSAYAPFRGLAPDDEWVKGARNFLYLMAMFNILLIRYIIMRIYIASGHIDFGAVVHRLSRAGIASLLTAGLPGIYGLVLYLLAGDLVDFYLLFGISIIYCMIYFPRYKNWISLIEEKGEG